MAGAIEGEMVGAGMAGAIEGEMVGADTME